MFDPVAWTRLYSFIHDSKTKNDVLQGQEKAPVGARAGQVRHKDNLSVDKASKFEGRREDTFVIKGERAEVRRHQDNLKMEGEFAKREQTGYKVDASFIHALSICF